MNETDLSDDAFWSCTDGMTRLQAWQECRRRAEEHLKEKMIPRHKHEAIVAQLEQEKREAFEAGYQKGFLHASVAEEADPIEAWKDYQERLKLKP